MFWMPEQSFLYRKDKHLIWKSNGEDFNNNNSNTSLNVVVVKLFGEKPCKKRNFNEWKLTNTFAIPEVITSGMGSVVSPIPRLITCASGYFSMCADLLLAI